MLRNSKFEMTYASGEVEPAEFFSEALINSSHFDLALGYFSTSGFRSLSLGFAHFIVNGGTARIVFNNTLSSKDRDLILTLSPKEMDELVQQRVISEFELLLGTLNKYDEHFFNCLSYLISTERIQLKSVVPSDNDVGVAHNKFCIFIDDDEDFVVSNGSANFSQYAFQNNSEVIDCFASWETSGRDALRAKDYRSRFENIWTGKHKKLRIIDLSEIKVRISNRFPKPALGDLLEGQQKLLDSHSKKGVISKKTHDILQAGISNSKPKTTMPKLPVGIDPYEYQKTAVKNWIASSYQGLFEMATGTGKTITALYATIQLLKTKRKLIIHIVAPTISLVNQWVDELIKCGFGDVTVASGENKKWESSVLSKYSSFQLGHLDQFVIVSTYATFGSLKYGKIISRMGEETLLIADECHYLGATNLQSRLPKGVKYRIGLSATPHRHFDDTGTTILLKYFNAIKTSTFQIDIKQAISEGYLCNYMLFPHLAKLTLDEFDEYKKISLKIVRQLGGQKKMEALFSNASIEKLLIDRRRILNQAVNKLEVVGQIIDEMSTDTHELKYTLVYCPEGQNEDQSEIIKYNKYLAFEKNLRVNVFTGETPPKMREKLLDQFQDGDIQCLLAMKCLDEGIDIRRTETAIFVASTTNPRQYVQRRGRILRTHLDKPFAKIHDILVLPPISDDSTAWLEKSLLRNEIKRFREFASVAINYIDCKNFIREIEQEYGIENDTE